jgi:hypothetical protein
VHAVVLRPVASRLPCRLRIAVRCFECCLLPSNRVGSSVHCSDHLCRPQSPVADAMPFQGLLLRKLGREHFDGRNARGDLQGIHHGDDLRSTRCAGSWKPPQGQFEFVARVTGRSQVTITAPLLNYHDKGSDDAFIEQLCDRDTMHEECFYEALQNQRREFDKLKIPNKMQYVLDFGPHVELCSEVLQCHRGKMDGLLTQEAMPTCVPIDAFPRAPMPVTNAQGNAIRDNAGNPILFHASHRYFCGVLYWRVADLSQGSRKARLDAVNTDTSAAVAMLRRMNLNRGNP